MKCPPVYSLAGKQSTIGIRLRYITATRSHLDHPEDQKQWANTPPYFAGTFSMRVLWLGAFGKCGKECASVFQHLNTPRQSE
jgi:hypothetical protein